MNTRVQFVYVIAIVVLFTGSPIARGTEVRQRDAWSAWENGNVNQAAELAVTLDDESERHDLLFRCSLVQGEYELALDHYAKISPSYEGYSELRRPVIDCYLHLARFADARDFAQRHAVGRADALKMRAEKPLQASLNKVTVIPFAEHKLTEYFPAFRAELEGQPVTIHIDTGSSFIAMGPDHAESLGIELIEYGNGNHGHRTVKLSFGIAKTFKLGDAILENVPVIVFPTLRGKQMNFGTCVLKEFLSTLDYPGGRLILSPHDDAELREKHMAMLPETRVELPFYMWGNHYMFARGSVGDDKRLNFFMDSGLVALRKINDDPTVQAGFTSSRGRFRKWGIAEVAMDQGIFNPNVTVGLGPLRKSGVWFLAGPGGEMHGTHKFGGVQMHGLLGHAFVKEYCWTLDFEKHTYIFSQGSNANAQSKRPAASSDVSSNSGELVTNGWAH